MKIVGEKKYDEVLGVHIIGPRATELISEAGTALRLEATSEELVRTIHESDRPTIVMATHSDHAASFGDYIVPTLVGPSGDFLGTAVYKYQGAIGNIPLAAALTVVPIVVVSAWLWLARRLGAFDAL